MRYFCFVLALKLENRYGCAIGRDFFAEFKVFCVLWMDKIVRHAVFVCQDGFIYGACMRKGIISFVFFAVASVQYVSEVVENKVDVSASANQTMAGSYTVSGSLVVPTPPLPTAD